MKLALRAIGLMGALAFGALFLFVSSDPKAFEESARAFAQYRVEKEILASEYYPDFIDEYLLRDVPNSEKEETRRLLLTHAVELMRAALTSACAHECKPGLMVTALTVLAQINRDVRIVHAKEKLFEIVNGKYTEIVEGLRADLKIFSGTNSIMFLSLLAISFLTPGAVRALFLPGMLLLGATILSTLMFVFGKDWFYAVIYNDFVGYGYLTYIGVTFGFLVDIVFAKAIVTSFILAVIGGAIASIC